jgi:hypothetical protein
VLSSPSLVVAVETKPLSENEKRQILELLLKYEALENSRASQLKACTDTVNGLNVLIEKEKNSYELSIKTAEDKNKLSEEKATAEKERGDKYEKLFKDVTKGKGWGCFFKRIFTLGLARCS